MCSFSTSFRNTILYSNDTLKIKYAYDALSSNENMKYLVRSKARDRETLVIHGGHGRGRLKSNFSNQVCFYFVRRNDIARGIATSCIIKEIWLQIKMAGSQKL